MLGNMRYLLRIVMFIVSFVLIGSVGISNAADLQFVWDYDATAQAIIEGFRLYQDGQPLPVVISPSDRSVSTPYIEDRQSRSYHLTAFSGSEESEPSATATVPAFFGSIPSPISFRFVE